MRIVRGKVIQVDRTSPHDFSIHVHWDMSHPEWGPAKAAGIKIPDCMMERDYQLLGEVFAQLVDMKIDYPESILLGWLEDIVAKYVKGGQTYASVSLMQGPKQHFDYERKVYDHQDIRLGYR